MERITVILERYVMRTGKRESGFVPLFVSKRLIHGAATALLGIFVPIYLYTITGEQFYIVGGFYALISILYALLLAPGMHITNSIGFSRALIVGSAFSVILYTILFFMNESNVWMLLPFFAIAILLFRIFHWVPYHVDFTMFTKSGERGRDVSLTFATVAFMGVVGPVLAGFIIANAGYSALFGVAVALLIFATVSYAFVPKTDVHFDWTYWQTWRMLFLNEYRPAVIGSAASGAEAIVTLVAWPIFLYEILSGDVFDIGAVSTIIVGATIAIQLGIGRYLDQGYEHKHKTLRVGSTLYAIGWVIKIFVLSAAQVFLVGLYHNVAKIFTKTPFNTILYDMSADQGKYVDEFTVIREMATHLGRAVSITLIALLTLVISIKWTFIVGAVAALLLNMIYRTAED